MKSLTGVAPTADAGPGSPVATAAAVGDDLPPSSRRDTANADHANGPIADPSPPPSHANNPLLAPSVAPGAATAAATPGRAALCTAAAKARDGAGATAVPDAEAERFTDGTVTAEFSVAPAVINGIWTDTGVGTSPLRLGALCVVVAAAVRLPASARRTAAAGGTVVRLAPRPEAPGVAARGTPLEPETAPTSTEPVEPEEPSVSAKANPGITTTAAPIPNATANAPTRPTCR